MRRRSMIQAALAAATLGAMPRAGRSAGLDTALTALAATLVPSHNWTGSPGAADLWERFSAREKAEQEQAGTALARLDRAAGGSFAALPLERRTAVLAELVERDEKFASAFGPLRALTLNVYFTSAAGLEFTGYRDCTQFEGYPEYFALSSEWE